MIMCGFVGCKWPHQDGWWHGKQTVDGPLPHMSTSVAEKRPADTIDHALGRLRLAVKENALMTSPHSVGCTCLQCAPPRLETSEPWQPSVDDDHWIPDVCR